MAVPGTASRGPRAQALGRPLLGPKAPVTRLGETAVPVARRTGKGHPCGVGRPCPHLGFGAPHRLRPLSCPPIGPADHPSDLYGSLSTRLGVIPRSDDNDS